MGSDLYTVVVEDYHHHLQLAVVAVLMTPEGLATGEGVDAGGGAVGLAAGNCAAAAGCQQTTATPHLPALDWPAGRMPHFITGIKQQLALPRTQAAPAVAVSVRISSSAGNCGPMLSFFRLCVIVTMSKVRSHNQVVHAIQLNVGKLN